MKTDKLSMLFGIASIILLFIGFKGFIVSVIFAILAFVLSMKNTNIYSRRVSRLLAGVSIIVVIIMLVYIGALPSLIVD